MSAFRGKDERGEDLYELGPAQRPLQDASPNTTLILIKHAMPKIVEDVPSRLWCLSEEGRVACGQLAIELASYASDVVVTSVEPKAAETGEIVASLLNIPCSQAPGLHENDRTGLPYLDTVLYETTFRRFFSNPDEHVVGNETARQASDRFQAAIDAVLADHPAQSIAIVAHGTVISLFLQRITGTDPFPFWQRLGLPSFVVLTRPGMKLERLVERLPALGS